TRLGLWAVCLAFPLQLATVLLLFTRLADARLADLGVTGRRLGRNLLLGVLGALALTPVCYGVLQLAVWAYHWWGAGGVHEHPYTVLAQQPLWPGEWALLLLAAVVVAPVWEELLFRGVLQGWFAARPWGGHVALALAFALTAWAVGDKVLSAQTEGASGVL